MALVGTAPRAIECRVGEKAPEPSATARAADLIAPDREADNSEQRSRSKWVEAPGDQSPGGDTHAVEEHPETLEVVVEAGTLSPCIVPSTSQHQR
jgi:hypothetical protein